MKKSIRNLVPHHAQWANSLTYKVEYIVNQFLEFYKRYLVPETHILLQHFGWLKVTPTSSTSPADI